MDTFKGTRTLSINHTRIKLQIIISAVYVQQVITVTKNIKTVIKM